MDSTTATADLHICDLHYLVPAFIGMTEMSHETSGIITISLGVIPAGAVAH